MVCHILIQARATSSRLKQKCFLPLCGKPLVWHVVNRLGRVKEADGVAVIIPDTKENDSLEVFLRSENILCFRGPEEDVLARYQLAARYFKSDVIVRVTGDNPLIHPEALDEMIKAHVQDAANYTCCEGLPLGCGGEVISRGCLLSLNPLQARCREHVTLYVRENPNLFKIKTVQVHSSVKRPDIRLTVDEEKDYELMSAIYRHFNVDYIPLEKVISFLDEHPYFLDINREVKQKVP